MGKVKDLEIARMNGEDILLDESPTGEEEEAALTRPEGYPTQEDLNLKSQEQDIQERKTFADRAYCMTKTWIGFLIFLTSAHLFIGKSSVYGLTELEFNIVFTTTTGSVFGFWVLVGRYLFSNNHKKD